MTHKHWKMPAWMKPYAPLITATGGNDIEELMRDHTANVYINAPRALICVAVKAQVALLERLYMRGDIR